MQGLRAGFLDVYLLLPRGLLPVGAVRQNFINILMVLLPLEIGLEIILESVQAFDVLLHAVFLNAFK